MADKANWTEEKLRVGDAELTVIKGGSGKPLLVLHGELGYPGWLQWETALAAKRTLWIPMHPGFGKSPILDWIMDVRDLAAFYSRLMREHKLTPTDVIGFSLGGWIAAEMAVANPAQFSKMILVGATGLRPPAGEIMDMFTVTARAYLNRNVLDQQGPEFQKMFGGEQIPEGKGMVQIKTNPEGAVVMHKGKAWPQLTPIKGPMDPGTYVVTIRMEGFKPVRREFVVEKGKTTEVVAELEHR